MYSMIKVRSCQDPAPKKLGVLNTLYLDFIFKVNITFKLGDWIFKLEGVLSLVTTAEILQGNDVTLAPLHNFFIEWTWTLTSLLLGVEFALI